MIVFKLLFLPKVILVVVVFFFSIKFNLSLFGRC